MVSKKVDWDLSMAKSRPFVAEILNKQGSSVSTFPQTFPEAECVRPQQLSDKYISADNEALELLNSSFFALLNAFESDSAVGVVDGLID